MSANHNLIKKKLTAARAELDEVTLSLEIAKLSYEKKLEAIEQENVDQVSALSIENAEIKEKYSLVKKKVYPRNRKIAELSAMLEKTKKTLATNLNKNAELSREIKELRDELDKRKSIFSFLIKAFSKVKT